MMAVSSQESEREVEGAAIIRNKYVYEAIHTYIYPTPRNEARRLKQHGAHALYEKKKLRYANGERAIRTGARRCREKKSRRHQRRNQQAKDVTGYTLRGIKKTSRTWAWKGYVARGHWSGQRKNNRRRPKEGAKKTWKVEGGTKGKNGCKAWKRR